MGDLVARLWRGEIDLPRAFWEYAILYGTLANTVTTVGTFAALAAGLPGAAALAIHLAPVPYNVFMAVAVWRSAGNYRGAPEWALLARIGVVVWAGIACLA